VWERQLKGSGQENKPIDNIFTESRVKKVVIEDFNQERKLKQSGMFLQKGFPQETEKLTRFILLIAGFGSAESKGGTAVNGRRS
jgi:hypothetical protein